MIRIVLDTNTAFSGLVGSGAPRELVLLAYRRRVELFGSAGTIKEFRRVLEYPRLQRLIRRSYLTPHLLFREYTSLLNVVDTRGVAPGVLVPADPDDEEFIRVAVASEARYLISRDKHLLDLDHYEDVQTLKPSVFMEGWRAASRRGDDKSKRSIWRRGRWRVWGKRVVFACWFTSA